MTKHYLLALLLGTASASYAQEPGPASRVTDKILAADGRPLFIHLRLDGAGYRASESGKALREQLQLAPDEQMVRVKSETDALGFTHEKYQQYYRGVKVEHATYSVHVRKGVIESLSGQVSRVEAPAIVPKVSATTALTQALRFVGATQYMWQVAEEEAGLKQREHNPNATYLPPGELVFVANSLSRRPAEKSKLTLAWKFDVYARQPLSRAYIYVDAQTGEVVAQDAIMKHAVGPFATRYSGTRNVETGINPGGGHRLRDNTRGSGVETYNSMRTNTIGGAADFIDNDNNWTAAEHDNANMDNAAGDAHFGAQATFDYWRDVHGRNSYDNAGAKLRSYVHFWPGDGSGSWDNAAWTGTEMVYGDGITRFKPLTSLDITAHEVGHAVCQSTADLDYQAESGALNEGFSDIWGAAIEQYTAAQLGLVKNTWLLGEEIVKSGAALRSMSDPRALGQPAYYGGQYWVPDPGFYTDQNDWGGVHTNSGVLNHWFYMLSQGKAGTDEGGNSYYVNGIGIAAAARIAYRAESVYLSATSNYAAARTFTIQAAADLYGPCSVEEAAVTNAWYAVGVGGTPPATPPISGPATICASPTTFQVNSSSVSWTASPASLFTVASGAGSQFTVQAAPGAAGRGIIAATACGGITTYRYVDVGAPSIEDISGDDYVCNTGVIVFTPVLLAPSANYTYYWYVLGTGASIKGRRDGPSVTVSVSSRYNFRMGVEISNGCGDDYSESMGFINGGCGGGAVAAYPNPASSDLTMEVTPPTTSATTSATVAEFDATLYDPMGSPVRTGRSQQRRLRFDVRMLPDGAYYLRTQQGSTAQARHIQIKH